MEGWAIAFKEVVKGILICNGQIFLDGTKPKVEIRDKEGRREGARPCCSSQH